MCLKTSNKTAETYLFNLSTHSYHESYSDILLLQKKKKKEDTGNNRVKQRNGKEKPGHSRRTMS